MSIKDKFHKEDLLEMLYTVALLGLAVGIVSGVIGGTISGIFITGTSFWLGFFRWFGMGFFLTASLGALIDGKILIGLGGIIGAAAGIRILGGVSGTLAGFAVGLVAPILIPLLVYYIGNRDKIRAQKRRDIEQAQFNREQAAAEEKQLEVRAKIDKLAQRINFIHSSIVSLERMGSGAAADAVADATVFSTLEKLHQFLAGLYKYYDSYCAILIKMEFQKMARQVARRDVSKIEMEHIFKDIDASIKNMESLQRNLRTMVKKGQGNSEAAGFLEGYSGKIRDLKLKMVSLQTSQIMSETSPVNEGQILAMLRFDDDSLQSRQSMAALDADYGKFIAEMEVERLLGGRS
ncbi:MAG: hypothetical protein FWG66_13895 [Spirochaetes bacterium]|nr:hypothetical protein [Spirochaetota bacterium]